MSGEKQAVMCGSVLHCSDASSVFTLTTNVGPDAAHNSMTLLGRECVIIYMIAVALQHDAQSTHTAPTAAYDLETLDT